MTVNDLPGPRACTLSHDGLDLGAPSGPGAPRPWWKVSIPVIGLMTLTACGGPSPDSEDAGGTDGDVSAAESKDFDGALSRTAASKVLVAEVEQREMVRAISTTVNAVSEREINIVPRTSGVAMDVHVEEGARVKAGDLLLTLDSRQAEATLAEARMARREAVDAKASLELAVQEADARVKRAELTYEQSVRELERKEGAGPGLLSKNELDLLRLTVQTNEADVATQRVARATALANVTSQTLTVEKADLQIARAELDLSFTAVEAPFGGVIASRAVRLGDLVSNAEPAFVLTDPDNVRAVVSRPQRELAFFRQAEIRAREEGAGPSAALDIEIEPEALPGEVYAGQILFVSPTIDATSGQFRVTLAIEQPKPSEARPPVLPGMLLRLRIVTERHPDALVVPKRALVREGDSFFVFICEDGLASKVRVDEGFANDDDVEVLPHEGEALTAGSAVVVVGNRDLEDGDRIEASGWGETPDEVVKRAGKGKGRRKKDTGDADSGEEAAAGEDATEGADVSTDPGGVSDSAPDVDDVPGADPAEAEDTEAEDTELDGSAPGSSAGSGPQETGPEEAGPEEAGAGDSGPDESTGSKEAGTGSNDR